MKVSSRRGGPLLPALALLTLLVASSGCREQPASDASSAAPTGQMPGAVAVDPQVVRAILGASKTCRAAHASALAGGIYTAEAVVVPGAGGLRLTLRGGRDDAFDTCIEQAFDARALPVAGAAPEVIIPVAFE